MINLDYLLAPCNPFNILTNLWLLFCKNCITFNDFKIETKMYRKVFYEQQSLPATEFTIIRHRWMSHYWLYEYKYLPTYICSYWNEYLIHCALMFLGLGSNTYFCTSVQWARIKDILQKLLFSRLSKKIF